MVLGSRRVVLARYDEEWPTQFLALASALRDALGDLGTRIDHIGSTSVPRLAAKDVIDVQITVADLDDDRVLEALTRAGARPRPDITRDHVPASTADPDPWHWCKRYVDAPPGWRPTHLHIRQQGRANQRYALLFRDYLRASAPAAGAYQQIKTALARLHPTDPGAYHDVKDPACDLIIDAAERWAAQTGYVPGPSDA